MDPNAHPFNPGTGTPPPELLGREPILQPIAVLIDELQYLPKADMAALIRGLHAVAQESLPLVMFGAGLPQLYSPPGLHNPLVRSVPEAHPAAVHESQAKAALARLSGR